MRVTDIEHPTKEDKATLKEILRATPELWRYIGDTAEQADLQIIQATKGTRALQESLLVGYEQHQKELGADDSTQLERLIIQQDVLSWLRLNLVECYYTNVTDKGGTYEKLMY